MKALLKIILTVLLLIRTSYSGYADVLDSLLLVLKTQNADTNKVKTLIEIGWEYSYSDIRQAGLYTNQALSLSEKLNYIEGKGLAYNLMGVVNRTTSDYTKAIEYFEKALQIRAQQGQTEALGKINVNLGNVYLDMADYSKADHYYTIAIEKAKQVNALTIQLIALTNLAAVYQNLGNYSKSLDYLFQALELNKQVKDEVQTGLIYANIAIIYQEQNQYDLAVEYCLKAIDIFKKYNRDDQLAIIYNALGIVYKSKEKYDLALKSFDESLRLYKKIGADATLNMVLHNVGTVYFDQKQYDKALAIELPILDSALKYGDNYITSRSMMTIADIYRIKGDYKKAREYAVKGLMLVEKEGDKEEIRAGYSTLANVFAGSKDFENAFIYQVRVQHLSDSINNDNISKRIGQMQAMYEADKKQKEIELLTKDKEIQEARIARQNMVTYLVIAGLIAVLVFAFISYKRYREKKKANIEITSQKEIIEQKNQEIVDSIHYAKRIQRALMASGNLLNKKLPEYFILYKPKDIVSGDFYWAQDVINNKEKKFLLATCDCTGHGVPGAFMSLLNISKLNETVIEKKITRPDLILNQVRDEIIKALNADKPENDATSSEALAKDGMDATLCCFDFENNKITFAAANNPLVIVRSKEIHEYKADKFPVGAHEGELKPFTLKTVDLQKGDCVYTFTDGYADQFGGEKGKKLMSKKLKEILSSISDKPLSDQKAELDQTFEQWRSTIEQVDDVLVIGVRI